MTYPWNDFDVTSLDVLNTIEYLRYNDIHPSERERWQTQWLLAFKEHDPKSFKEPTFLHSHIFSLTRSKGRLTSTNHWEQIVIELDSPLSHSPLDRDHGTDGVSYQSSSQVSSPVPECRDAQTTTIYLDRVIDAFLISCRGENDRVHPLICRECSRCRLFIRHSICCSIITSENENRDKQRKELDALSHRTPDWFCYHRERVGKNTQGMTRLFGLVFPSLGFSHEPATVQWVFSLSTPLFNVLEISWVVLTSKINETSRLSQQPSPPALELCPVEKTPSLFPCPAHSAQCELSSHSCLQLPVQILLSHISHQRPSPVRRGETWPSPLARSGNEESEFLGWRTFSHRSRTVRRRIDPIRQRRMSHGDQHRLQRQSDLREMVRDVLEISGHPGHLLRLIRRRMQSTSRSHQWPWQSFSNRSCPASPTSLRAVRGDLQDQLGDPCSELCRRHDLCHRTTATSTLESLSMPADRRGEHGRREELERCASSSHYRRAIPRVLSTSSTLAVPRTWIESSHEKLVLDSRWTDAVSRLYPREKRSLTLHSRRGCWSGSQPKWVRWSDVLRTWWTIQMDKRSNTLERLVSSLLKSKDIDQK